MFFYTLWTISIVEFSLFLKFFTTLNNLAITLSKTIEDNWNCHNLLEWMNLLIFDSECSDECIVLT